MTIALSAEAQPPQLGSSLGWDLHAQGASRRPTDVLTKREGNGLARAHRVPLAHARCPVLNGYISEQVQRLGRIRRLARSLSRVPIYGPILMLLGHHRCHASVALRKEKRYRRKTPKQLAQEAIFEAMWASGGCDGRLHVSRR